MTRRLALLALRTARFLDRVTERLYEWGNENRGYPRTLRVPSEWYSIITPEKSAEWDEVKAAIL